MNELPCKKSSLDCDLLSAALQTMDIHYPRCVLQRQRASDSHVGDPRMDIMGFFMSIDEAKVIQAFCATALWNAHCHKV
jgi:hypothetical protein